MFEDKGFSILVLQTFTNTRPYSQPFSTAPVEGDRFDLPQDFVEGLSFLASFVKRSGDPVETWVHLIGGKLYVITNSLILEFGISENDLPDLKLSLSVIRALEAFGAPPDALSINGEQYLFTWADGQELFVEWKRHVRSGDAKVISDARGSDVRQALAIPERESYRR